MPAALPARTDLASQAAPPLSLGATARYWLRLGLISFGGPAGQVALMHAELVERRRWLSERRFLHALNYAMVLPGPEAQQLATYIGWLMHGIPGGLVAGGLFILPSLLLLILLSAIYAVWGSLPLLSSVFMVLKPAVTAIVAQAAWRIGRRTLHTPALLAIALLAFLGLAVLKLPFPLLLALAALTGGLGCRFWPRAFVADGGHRRHGSPESDSTDVPGAQASNNIGTAQAFLHGDDTLAPAHARLDRRRALRVLLAGLLAVVVPLALLSAIGGWDGLLATMARFFSRVAVLSFGGAYAVLPYVAQGAVEQHGWLGADQMIDGLALGESTPGPLIMVVTFVGFMAGWTSAVNAAQPEVAALSLATAAALTVTWFTFLPSFLFILVGGPFVEASRADHRLQGPLTAITAAVVGVIANLAVFFAGHVLWPQGAGGPFKAWALALMLLGAWLLIARRWPVLRLIAAAAAVGALTTPLGG
ncbi:chromate efflux transporter [Synechococcus sp. BA-124 BA4]|uniref:chromate efflux transporter n=1 Tax=unclassified Synechococcus TaxID=2626047 RepID=UPI002AD430B0|nr:MULTISPECIES: chromate efflux transporter [unclassified Synechococcus]MEA5399976.1 chromate efflux transporter [Synechococcus sp. BA-124 BA4]CAK6697410.1 hypothetical protein BBFGKLBO_02247 [Synechococcus sp. CBW1107]